MKELKRFGALFLIGLLAIILAAGVAGVVLSPVIIAQITCNATWNLGLLVTIPLLIAAILFELGDGK